jgi:hypothetical protein
MPQGSMDEKAAIDKLHALFAAGALDPARACACVAVQGHSAARAKDLLSAGGRCSLHPLRQQAVCSEGFEGAPEGRLIDLGDAVYGGRSWHPRQADLAVSLKRHQHSLVCLRERDCARWSCAAP